MRWLKRNSWKIGIAILCVMLLVFIAWMLFSVVGSSQPGPATTTGGIQTTPTVNVTAVVQDQLKQEDDKLRRENSGLWPFWLTISGSLGTILPRDACMVYQPRERRDFPTS